MSQAKKGDTVKVHLTARLENGEVFSNSKDDEPLEFTLGSGDLIPGFEKAVIGMEAGETKTITVPPDEAYGPRNEELVVNVSKSALPENITPAIGQQLQIPHKEGNPIKVTISDMNEDTVTLDANHPLAGNTLFFDVELVEIA